MIKTKIVQGTGTQVAVIAMVEASFDDGFPAQTPLIPADSGDLVETDLNASSSSSGFKVTNSGGVGTMVIRPLKAVGASGYSAPDPDASGVAVDTQDNTEATPPYSVICRVSGNFPQTGFNNQDAFLQIWSYPVATTVKTADDSTTTGTLSDGDTSNATHTLVYSERIFENLMFNCKLAKAIAVKHAIVAISNKELSFDITSPNITETNFMVEIETYA